MPSRPSPLQQTGNASRRRPALAGALGTAWAGCVALLLTAVGPAHATPVRMTFEGSVFSLEDAGGVAAAAGIGPSSTLRYTVIVDREAEGLVTTDGFDELQPDEVVGDTTYDRFFATYVSGDHLASESVGFQSNRTNHVGQNVSATDGTFGGELFTGNLLTFGAESLFVEDWEVGSVVYVRDWWTVGSEGGHVSSWATLTERVVVPEPATGTLAALGLLALAGYGRRVAVMRRSFQ